MPREGAEGLVVKCAIAVFTTFCEKVIALGSAANWFSLGQCHPGINSCKWEGNSKLHAGCL